MSRKAKKNLVWLGEGRNRDLDEVIFDSDSYFVNSNDYDLEVPEIQDMILDSPEDFEGLSDEDTLDKAILMYEEYLSFAKDDDVRDLIDCLNELSGRSYVAFAKSARWNGVSHSVLRKEGDKYKLGDFMIHLVNAYNSESFKVIFNQGDLHLEFTHHDSPINPCQYKFRLNYIKNSDEIDELMDDYIYNSLNYERLLVLTRPFSEKAVQKALMF